MQETTLIIATLTPFLLLLMATVALLVSFIKQKKIMRLQQQKLLELIDTLNQSGYQPKTPAKSYKDFVYEQLKFTQDRFEFLSPRANIADALPISAPLNQRIVTLRHAFLRAEELGASTVQGSEGYWSVFQQALEPLLAAAPENQDSEELETFKKRVANLEKFKTLFFDLEKRWNEAQNNAQQYYNELYAMVDSLDDKERFQLLLGQFNDSYKDMNQYIYATNAAISDPPAENKTINIIRHDPRAAEEILKLRNVAADQYRIINNLQRKLEEAVTAEQKDSLIQELEQQLQRQVRFVQESDTCMQLLEDELTKANEKIAHHENLTEKLQHLEEENQLIKETLHNFISESKELLINIEELERENEVLRNTLPPSQADQDEAQHLHNEIIELRKQYTELEEKYLLLKMS